LVKVPAFVFDAGGRMEQKEKRSQVSSVSTEGQITGGGRLRQQALDEGSLVPSDVPDGLTNINGSEIAAQFENSDDHRDESGGPMVRASEGGDWLLRQAAFCR
jgi:hypothetical protein